MTPGPAMEIWRFRIGPWFATGSIRSKVASLRASTCAIRWRYVTMFLSGNLWNGKPRSARPRHRSSPRPAVAGTQREAYFVKAGELHAHTAIGGKARLGSVEAADRLGMGLISSRTSEGQRQKRPSAAFRPSPPQDWAPHILAALRTLGGRPCPVSARRRGSRAPHQPASARRVARYNRAPNGAARRAQPARRHPRSLH